MSRSPVTLSRFSAGLYLLAALTGAGVGRAAPEDSPAASVAANELPEAKALYEDAARAAEAKNFPRALELLQRSYALSRRAWLLYNLGSLHRELGDCRLALQSFEQYLKEVPNGTYREQADEAIKQLRPACALGWPREVLEKHAPDPLDAPAGALVPPVLPSRAQRPQHPGAPERVERRNEPALAYWTPRRKVALVVFGGGALAAGTAVFYGVRANERDQELATASRAAGALPAGERPSWSAAARSVADERRADRTRTIAFSIAAAMCGGAGLVLLLSSSDDPTRGGAPHAPRRPRAAHSLDVRTTPGGVLVNYSASAF